MPQLGEVRKGKEIWGTRGTSFDRHKWIWSACELCGKERWVFLYKGKALSTKCKLCSDKIHGIRLSGMPHKRDAKIGNRVEFGSGYIKIRMASDDPYISMADRDCYILEHRLVMARKLGRLLKNSEMVHHLNGIRDDNREENLALTTRNNHEGNTYIKALQKRIRELEQLHLL